MNARTPRTLARRLRAGGIESQPPFAQNSKLDSKTLRTRERNSKQARQPARRSVEVGLTAKNLRYCKLVETVSQK